MESIDTVLELIADGVIYRGEESKPLINAFKNIKKEFDTIPDDLKSNFVWANLSTTRPEVAKFRNTAIGTLVINISNDMDIDVAVRQFEAMMYNYKRTNQVITKKQIEDAKKKIEELGYLSSLNRRYATLQDISINNVLFSDSSQTTKRIMNTAFDDLIDNIPDVTKKSSNKLEEIPIDKFIKDIIPHIKTMEILVENTHVGNFVSLITADDPTAKLIFKWNNPFTWSYTGDNADSIKTRVKLAGGLIGAFNCRVGWFNTDDLDAHMLEPGGREISFRCKKSSMTGGKLDVDMNVNEATAVRNPVENITYETIAQMKPGEYHYFISQFNRRESRDYGFDAEIEILGSIYNFTYRQPIADRKDVYVATFRKLPNIDDRLELVKSHIDNSIATRSVWNLMTQKFHRVNTFMLSPNYWGDNKIGNKHYMFMIDNCFNDGSARGFYNEFLGNELTPYRKVMDVIGSKMRTSENDVNQLSGLGFSSTVRNKVTVRVTGNYTRTIVVTI